MDGDQEREEELVVLVDVPAEQTRGHDSVAEARDRKQLRDSLEQSEHDCLEVRDRMHSDVRTRAARCPGAAADDSQRPDKARFSKGSRNLLLIAVAAAALTGCGLNVASPDLFVLTRTGQPRPLTMLVNDGGTIRCNGGRSMTLSDPLLIQARALASTLDKDAKATLRIPPRPRQRRRLFDQAPGRHDLVPGHGGNEPSRARPGRAVRRPGCPAGLPASGVISVSRSEPCRSIARGPGRDRRSRAA